MDRSSYAEFWHDLLVTLFQNYISDIEFVEVKYDKYRI